MIPIPEEKLIPIPESGCLVWVGGATADGYGSIRYKYKHYLAHRVAWENANGPIADGLHVCHKCDVPSCCRVDHLFLGTNQENIADSVRKGRRKGITRNRPSGLKYDWTEKDRAARLARRSIKNIEQLKNDRRNGATLRQLAKKYGVSSATAFRAIRGYE
jgi:hypothetical protein